MAGPKALFDMSEDELKAGVRSKLPHLEYSGNDYLRELDRRAAERHAKSLRRMTFWLATATVVYTLATLALVVVTWLKAP